MGGRPCMELWPTSGIKGSQMEQVAKVADGAGRQARRRRGMTEVLGSWTHAGGRPCPDLWLPAAARVLSTKASRQYTLGYTHGSTLSVDGAQATNLMVTQDTDKLFIQVRPPYGRNTYVLRLVVLIVLRE